jgi:hypothetical protein
MEQQQIKIENYKSTFNNLLEKFKKINFMKDAHVSNSRYDAIKNKERHAIRVLSYCVMTDPTVAEKCMRLGDYFDNSLITYETYKKQQTMSKG